MRREKKVIIEADLEFIFESNRMVQSVLTALLPDNKVVPKDLEIETSANERLLKTRIVDSTGDIMRIRNTVEDVVDSTRIAVDAIISAGKIH